VQFSNFVLFSPQAEAGVSIPYPSISIHAVKQVDGPQEGSKIPAVWMQLEFADGGADDDDFNTVELTITPKDSDATPTHASQLYEAVANCSNLHPDPNNEDESDGDEYDRIVFEGGAEHETLEGFTGVLRGNAEGGLPPPMPGSGGWITADNVHEYFDEEGNWIGGNQEESGELGEGAGRTRGRDELEADAVNGNGTADEDPENKRPRVDGA
jgi:nucleotide-sensitive chloride channel 1A